MDLQLKDKVVIVTGGDKGIGFGICQVLANEGAIPVIVGRKEKDVLQAVKTIKASGGTAFYAIAELTDPEQCKNIVVKVTEKYGQIYGLVNNAGANDGVGLENGTYDDFVASINKSLTHYFMMAKYVLPSLKKSKGAIVNIGSKVSVTGQGGTSGYAAANGGRNSLTREWALELLPFGIRTNEVLVAECYTPMYERWIKSMKNGEQKLKEIMDGIPLEKRMTTAEEIANMVVFLLSEKSSHTTGQQIYVDGGYTHLDRAL